MNVVYQIHIGPNKQIGSTADCENRIKQHKKLLFRNSHYNVRMQRSWNKYATFTHEILSIWETREEAYKEEQRLLNLYFGKENYMMLCDGAFGAKKGRVSPMKGRKQSSEHKRKIADAHRGQKMTDQQKLNVSIGHIKYDSSVLQFDKKGNFINKWNSIREIEEFNIYSIIYKML